MTISAKIGFGKKAEGEIVMVGTAGNGVETRQVTFNEEGKIVVAPVWVPREFLEKASLVGVCGAVVGSIHFRDYEYFRENLDFPLIVLTKFGKLDVEADLIKKLQGFSGKKGVLDGEGKTLTV